MRLSAYLDENRIKRSAFAETIRVSPGYVTDLCEDRCWPGRDVILRIREATGGAVTADDFLPAREDAEARP